MSKNFGFTQNVCLEIFHLESPDPGPEGLLPPRVERVEGPGEEASGGHEPAGDVHRSLYILKQFYATYFNLFFHVGVSLVRSTW